MKMITEKVKTSVTYKVNIIVLLCIFVIMTCVGIFFYFYERRSIYRSLTQTSLQIAKRFEHNLIQPVWEYNYEQVNLIFELEMEYPHIYAILFEDSEKNVKAGKIKTSTGEIINYSPDSDFQYELTKCFRVIKVNIHKNDYLMGTALIYLTDTLLRDELLTCILQLFFKFLLLSFVLYFILLFSLKKLILNPLSLIDRTVQQFASKDFSVKVPPLPQDELGRLADSFNKMAETILAYSQNLEKKVQERTKELEKANRFQSRFFANISHEFRTPLTLILGPVEAALSGDCGESIHHNDPVFHMIFRNGTRLLKLINNILDFSEIEANKMNVHKTKTNIEQLLRFCVSTVQASGETKGVHIIFNNNTDGEVIAWVDKVLFEKAIFNLISNAFKFTPQGGHILVQLDEYPYYMNEDGFDIHGYKNGKKEYFSVSVKDTGIGIPEEKIETIFDRFKQVGNTTQQKLEGPGIGLALTKEIVNLHKGKIVVKSFPGEGSTFTIILPYGAREDSEYNGHDSTIEAITKVEPYWLTEVSFSGEENRACSTTREAPKILVVDDAPDMRSFLTSILQPEYIIIEAQNGQEGLEKARVEKPDLIIADVMMPEMDGYDMTSLLRTKKELQGVPILLLTARAEVASRIQGLEKGANDYIVKPFNAQELKARVKTNLEMKRLRDLVEEQRDTLALQKKDVENTLEQKILAYKQLEDIEKRFREIAEFLPSVIAEIDVNLKFTYLNRAGIEFFKITQEDVKKGCYIHDYVHPDDRERFTREIQNMLQYDSAQVYEYSFSSSNGKQHFALLKSAPLFQENRISGLRLVIIQIHSYLNLIRMPDKQFYTQYNISRREKEVLIYLLKGFKNKEIGEKLFISEITVKKHVSNILQKTDSKNRSELINLLRNLQKGKF